MPSGDIPSLLIGSYFNPESKDLKYELVNQLLATKLNVAFDLYDPDFAPAIGNLEGLLLNFTRSSFHGKTVKDIILIAD